MDVAFVDDHVSMTDWPAWAEAGEALRATLGDDGGASCAAAMGFLPLAINASANKPNKIAVRSERKRIVPHSLFTELHMKRQAQNVLPPPVLHGHRITEFNDGRKLFLGAEFERGALGQEDLFVRPPKEGRGELAAANLQAESYLERAQRATDWAWRRARNKGQRIDITSCSAALSRATSSILTHKVRAADFVDPRKHT